MKPKLRDSYFKYLEKSFSTFSFVKTFKVCLFLFLIIIIIKLIIIIKIKIMIIIIVIIIMMIMERKFGI